MFVVRYVIYSPEIYADRCSKQSCLSVRLGAAKLLSSKGKEPQKRLRCVYDTGQVSDVEGSWAEMMSRDFISENSILGRYPGGHSAIGIGSRRWLGPQNTPVWLTDQCLSAICLFPACEETSAGIGGSDLETCPLPQIVREALLYKATMDIQRWGDVGLGSG